MKKFLFFLITFSPLLVFGQDVEFAKSYLCECFEESKHIDFTTKDFNSNFSYCLRVKISNQGDESILDNFDFSSDALQILLIENCDAFAKVADSVYVAGVYSGVGKKLTAKEYENKKDKILNSADSTDIGFFYVRAGKFDKALSILEPILKDKDIFQTNILLSLLYKEQGELGESMFRMQRAQSQKGDDVGMINILIKLIEYNHRQLEKKSSN